MSCDERATRRQGRDAATTLIRPLRGGDLREVLAIVRQAFPEDSWTLETAKGRLARSPLGAQTRNAVRLEQLIRLARLGEIINLVRLAGVVALRRRAKRYCIVADTDGAIVGYACLNAFASGRGDLQTIAVRDDHQGEGIGTALLTDLIAAAAVRGCRDIFLDVPADNIRARLLYRRTGFIEVGVRPNYYQPSGTEATVMRLRLRAELAGVSDDHGF